MIKVLREATKADLEDWIYNIDLEDPKLYEELRNPNMIGIFQLSGKSAERLKNDIQPKNFNELNATNAMARPGPMENAPMYVAQKEGAKSSYPPMVRDILKETYGVCLFQEDIMEIFHKVGGFSLEEANEVRNLMKKLGKAEKNESDLKKWNTIIKKFVKGSVKNGITEKSAIQIADDLKLFSGYSFCKAHSISYSYIAAITLYLSYYLREHFYSSLLSTESDQSLLEKLIKIKAQGIGILPPDINKSDVSFSALKDGSILFGLSNIKYVSPNSAAMIISHRPFKSFFDFIIKTRSRSITSAVIKALISVGAFDQFEENRKKTLFMFNKFWKSKKSIKVEEKLHVIYSKLVLDMDRVPGLETKIDDLTEYEKSYFGFNFFSTPFVKERIEVFLRMAKKRLIKLSFSDVNQTSAKIPIYIKSIRSFKDRNENSMAFLTAEDMYGNQESFPIFHSYFQHIGSLLEANKLYLLNMYKSEDEKIMFGQDGWINNAFKIKRMVKKV